MGSNPFLNFFYFIRYSGRLLCNAIFASGENSQYLNWQYLVSELEVITIRKMLAYVNSWLRFSEEFPSISY